MEDIKMNEQIFIENNLTSLFKNVLQSTIK